MPVATGENSFYFYNPQTVADGKRQFQTRWGRRLLEDNWRRLKKAMNTFVDNQDSNVLSDNVQGTPPDRGNQVVSVDSLPSPVASQDPKDPAFYLQQIPLTEEDLLASDLIIADGLFNMGKIYKDKLLADLDELATWPPEDRQTYLTEEIEQTSHEAYATTIAHFFKSNV